MSEESIDRVEYGLNEKYAKLPTGEGGECGASCVCGEARWVFEDSIAVVGRGIGGGSVDPVAAGRIGYSFFGRREDCIESP